MLKIRRNLSLDVSSSKSLATSLDACTLPNDPFFNTLIRILATRCMLSAEYFPSGTFSPPDYRHYGLATEIYTHFTSPIRRYADVVVHRQLSAAIGLKSYTVRYGIVRVWKMHVGILTTDIGWDRWQDGLVWSILLVRV